MGARSNSFATFLIVGPTCFFLGIIFSSFPYDYNVLWHVPQPPDTRDVYFDLLENHLKFLHASPPLISRILHIVIGTGLLGFVTKLYKPSEANMLFDGASLVLYMVGVIVYITNIVKGLRIVTSGNYGQGEIVESDPVAAGAGDVEYIGREDSLRVLAASNTILALVLVGVLVLQAGQWYAQRKEDAEIAEMDRVAEEKRKGKEGKKKQ
ncbi:putative secretory component protein shr3 protein [Neofusicoccum parvum UCRNP2]|uniref:Protein csh3 n=3 Tax=Neofusicoccum TaxID=407951 RepID=A0ABR3SG80_9PEZI|nr:putative secretory component protein shr3 protein [Neofusicoccum parvum UCRNP2]GME26097.1 Secretory component protein shr3 [Neofusicoccum parvum]